MTSDDPELAVVSPRLLARVEDAATNLDDDTVVVSWITPLLRAAEEATSDAVIGVV